MACSRLSYVTFQRLNVVRRLSSFTKVPKKTDNNSQHTTNVGTQDMRPSEMLTEGLSLSGLKIGSEESMQKIQSDIEMLKKLKEEYETERKKEQRKMRFLEKQVEVDYTKKSNIPCGGCGALLHSCTPEMPGFVHRELYDQTPEDKIPELLCQRCDSLKYNRVINQEVDARVYKHIVNQVQRRLHIVVMMIDVTDITNSVVHDFIKKVGYQAPLVIIGNKVDLIPRDGKGYLERILQRVKDECYIGLGRSPNIVHSCLISAKTGYGVELLINKLLRLYWEYDGDVYLVGMANSGKSSLFNLFLRSDYCKYTCRDVIQRATVSQWPGTTLSLIKFPIMRPREQYIAMRLHRLEGDQVADKVKREKRLTDASKMGEKSSRNTILFGSVNKTEFRSEEKVLEMEKKNITTPTCGYSPESLSNVEDGNIKDGRHSMYIARRTVNPVDYPDSKWFYDTPGLRNDNQCIHYLTPEELRRVLKMLMVRPRVFVMAPGQTMFATGLARIDYLEGVPNTLFTVHINHTLPVFVGSTEAADDFYAEHVGFPTLAVPLGDQDRVNKLPSLCGKEFWVDTHDSNKASADIQLSSLGWVSLAARPSTVGVRAYTPGGLGMSLRTPALLPNILAFKGTRVSGSKMYKMKKLKK